jgi:EAL domain-containing protein (putative c-di-GMP-specific phosphodiesterase class I)
VAESVSSGAPPALDRLAGDPWVSWLLETARERVGTDIAFLSDFTDSAQRVRVVAGNQQALDIAAGTTIPLSGTFCVRVLSNLLPPVVTAAARDPHTRDLAVVAGGHGIGSYVGAPIRTADGRALGMLCCVSRDEGAQLDAEAARFVDFLAELVGQRLTEGAGPDEARARVDAVLAEDAVRIAFQPIVEIATGRVTGYEALSRFEDADTAGMFADAALSGRGIDLELLALRAALSALREHPVDVPVGINLSPEALLAPGVLDLLTAPRPQPLGVEVTEHRPVADYAALGVAREALRAAGVLVSVDDAGAGYASMQHVLRLRPDVLKLDAAIVSGVHLDPAKQALITALVGFADEIGASVVAEGVETEQERDALARRGIRHGQGWLWGRPGPLPQAEEPPSAVA